jgi:hypothetical protein
MRIATAVVALLVTYPAFGQTAKSIPDEFLAKMATDLAKLHAEPADTNDLVILTNPAAGTTTTQYAPSSVKIGVPNAAVLTTAQDNTPTMIPVTPGTDLPVQEAVPGWYKVKLGKEQGWIAKEQVIPDFKKISTTSQNDETWLNRQILLLTQKAAAFRDSYRDNPYLNVKGFSLSIGMPPSVNVAFEFK